MVERSGEIALMITLEEYFGPWLNSEDVTPERKQNAIRLLHSVAALEYFAVRDGVEFPVNPHTGTGVAGQTMGGFRPQFCTQGAPHSAHKEGLAVDRWDPEGKIDSWCMDNQVLLATCRIWLECPGSTVGWSHWTIRAPASGRRVFQP